MDIITRKLSDLIKSGVPQPVLQLNHNYHYITFSSGLGTHSPFLMSFEPSDHNSGGKARGSFYVRPGDKIPVRDGYGKPRQIYLYPLESDTFLETNDFGSNQPRLAASISVDIFCLNEREAATVSGIPYREGEKICLFDQRLAAGVITAGTRSDLFVSSNLYQFNIGQCYFHLHISGGGVYGGALGTSYPIELVLEQSDSLYAGVGTVTKFTLLFPGDNAFADVIIPVPKHDPFMATSGGRDRWCLYVQNPTGNSGSHSELAIRGALIAGDHEPFANYDITTKRSAVAANGTVTVQHYHAFSVIGPGAANVAFEVINAAGVAAMDIRGCGYVPTGNGGPARSQQTSAAPAAGASASGSFTNRYKHYFFEGVWGAGGTGLGYSIGTNAAK
jgi:hypothetical protein